MEDIKSSDSLGNGRLPTVRVKSFRTTSLKKSDAQFSPSFRNVRTPRKDEGGTGVFVQIFRYLSPRRLPWMILIGLWVFFVFRMYSSGPRLLWNPNDDELRQHISRGTGDDPMTAKNRENSGISRLARDWIWGGYLRNKQAGLQEKAADTGPKKVLEPHQKKAHDFLNSTEADFAVFQSLKAGDYFLGDVIGPYDKLERQVLGPKEDHGVVRKTCTNEEQFANYIKGKKVVLVVHELSMTGSPLAMLELATEITNCGGKVSLVILDRRGGLLNEVVRRKLSILRDKTTASWRAATKADLVVAGSAVCSSWIHDYLSYHKRGGGKVVWWIMENRRFYFDRSKHVLPKVRSIMFLSEIQAAQWHQWSKEEKIRFPSDSSNIVALSVNDHIASIAGLGENGTLAWQRLQTLRQEARKDMGLGQDDMVFISLSSINPGKGQLLLLHAASIVANEIEEARRLKEDGSDDMTKPGRYQPMKLVIGSIGSKSNKPEYVGKLLNYLNQHPVLTKSIMWTPATVSVSSLYAAADVYLMNAQGIGETFGRVTVEAMAFGLPVLGTDAGGTREIVDSNTTGILHPVGTKGASFLARDMLFLLNNPMLGKQMGDKGRDKVNRLYTKSIMYEKLALVFKNSTTSVSKRRS